MAKQAAPEQTVDVKKARADAFWGIFLPVKDGKVKSTILVNSFCFSILCLAVYIAAYLLLLDVLDEALAGRMHVVLINIIESLVPAIAGTLVCCAFHFLFKEKKIVPAAYTWLLAYAVAGMIAILWGLEPSVRATALQLMMLCVPAPLLTGCSLAAYLYLRSLKKAAAHPPLEELPPWKRKKYKHD